MRGVRGAIVVLLCLPLSACFFWSGGGLEGTAYLHADSPSVMSIELRESTWRTGNLHIPFDFTVYETQTTYLLKGPVESLANFGPGAELWHCGVRVREAVGSARFDRESLSVDLSFGESAKPRRLRGAVTVVPASNPPRPCGHHSH